MTKDLKNKTWIGDILILLAWFSELIEELDLALWERGCRASIITIILIIAFQAGKIYYPKIQKGESKWYILLFILLFLSLISFLFNSIFIDPYESAINRRISYFTLITFDMLAIIQISMAMFLSWAYYVFEKNKENELALSQLKTLNKESELNELKKQINPHFLFNALSNIYSIAYLKDDRTPEKIMQLSKMLRYVIYESDVEFIELSKEIEHLKRYIDFQKFKIAKEQQIIFEYPDIIESVKIAPMLLLPFIENAFKHSQIAIEPDAWVRIKLQVSTNRILFSVENTVSSKPKEEILMNPGIGIENISKRLEIIYHSGAELNIVEDETYKVDLIINEPN